MNRVPVPGGELASVSYGSGPVVVLLHAGGLDSRMWRALVPRLTGYRVIVYDARGFGRSSSPTAAFRHDRDLVALLDALAVERAALVGVSMGAQTAVDAALENPGRVAGLVVTGAGGGVPDWSDPWALSVLERWAAAERAGDQEGWVAAFLSFLPGPSRTLADVPAALVAEQDAMVRDTLARHVTPALLAGRAPIVASPLPSARERLPELASHRVPVLAVHGALDSPDHVRFAQRVADAAGGSSVTIAGAGHYPSMEEPAEFGRVLTEFLDSRAH